MNDVVNRFGYAFDAAHGRVPGPIAPLQDEPQDENSIRPIKTTKTVLVPQIQSMKDYILRHHKRMILGTLNRNIREGMLRLPMAHAETNTVLTSASCSFRDMNFWRVDKYTALADVIIDVDVFGEDEIRTISLYAEMWINMEKGMQFRMGECGYLEQLPERPYWRLSNYLIPILRKEEIEAGGEELLLRLIPDALTDKQMHNPFVLAERMGLQVMRLPLYDNTRTLSMLFFAAGTVTVQDDPESEDNDPPPPYTVTIPHNTILINTHAVHKDYCQLEVYHECIHYDWHFMFYRLQDMHNNDVNALKTKRIVVTDTKKNKNPLTWMEWQANRGSFALMMPLGMMRPVVGRYWNESSSSMHYGKRYDYVARRIASEYDLPKFRVRARLIQMGKIPAKGALNYVDGSYIEPFAFDIDKGNGDYTFVLTRKNLFAAYNASGAFREQIDSGRYVFVDGHPPDPQAEERGRPVPLAARAEGRRGEHHSGTPVLYFSVHACCRGRSEGHPVRRPELLLDWRPPGHRLPQAERAVRREGPGRFHGQQAPGWPHRAARGNPAAADEERLRKEAAVWR